jgi:surface antigen
MTKQAAMAAVAVCSALSLGASMSTAPVNADATGSRTPGTTTDHNPLAGYEGYCTWGAQEQIHNHTGYYVRALTGNAEDWANEARAAGWTVVGEPQPHSVAVFSSALVGGVGHVAWVDGVNGRNISITEMNVSFDTSADDGYRTSGFGVFDTRTAQDAPGMSYILIP